MVQSETFDRVDEPCPCGKGRVRMTIEVTETMFPGRPDWQAWMTCTECAVVYELRHRSHILELRHKADLEARAEAVARFQAARHPFEKILDSDYVHPARALLLARVDRAGRSYSAWFRAVRDILPIASVADLKSAVGRGRTFHDWVVSQVTYENIEFLADKLGLGRDPQPVLSALAQVRDESLGMKVRTFKYDGTLAYPTRR